VVKFRHHVPGINILSEPFQAAVFKERDDGVFDIIDDEKTGEVRPTSYHY